MTSRNILFHPRLLVTACLLALSPAAWADDLGPTEGIGISANTESKLISDFSAFLGGDEPAASVITGLRQGTAFSLEPPPTSTETTLVEPVLIEPPTGSMGYGNVRITLKLAEGQLSSFGITNPTTEQLSAILLGGEIDTVPVDGILAMRAEGMGWGEIAHAYDTTVGKLMGNGAGNTATLPATTTSAGTRTSAYANGYIPSGKGKALGLGIVSGTGSSVSTLSSSNGNGKGQSVKTHGQGTGLVSAGGQQASATGISHAGGNGKGQALGLQKKD